MSLIRTLVRDFGVQSVPFLKNKFQLFGHKLRSFFCFGFSLKISNLWKNQNQNPPLNEVSFCKKKDLIFWPKKDLIFWPKKGFIFVKPLAKNSHFGKMLIILIHYQGKNNFLRLSFQNDTSFRGAICSYYIILKPHEFFKKGTDWQVLKSWRDSYVYMSIVFNIS